MAGEERRIIEGRWTCSTCDTSGLFGRHGHCTACGNPRGEEELDFSYGETNEDGSSSLQTVTEHDLLQRAALDPDWFCSRCDGGNPSNAVFCGGCGASREERADLAEEKPRQAVETPRRKLGPLVGLLALVPASFATVCLGCCGLGALVGDGKREVDAVVVARNYHRTVTPRRLVKSIDSGWKDTLPAEARPPGTGTLHAGRGELQSCEPVSCWPRLPEQTTARIVGKSWKRTIQRSRLVDKRKRGWADTMPAREGRRATTDRVGREGFVEATCESRVKTEKRCRTVQVEESCGTRRECRIVDKKNGFAEEVCKQVPKTCRVDREECKPAVRQDHCSWVELRFKADGEVVLEGTVDPPRWPEVRDEPGVRLHRKASQRLRLMALTGEIGPLEETVPDAVFGSARVGDLVAVPSLERLPETLQTDDVDRRDCGSDAPSGVLGTRETCTYERWSWREEDPVEVHGSAMPDWPPDGLSGDGVSERDEWVDVTLSWDGGEHELRLEVAEFEAWSMGTTVPIIVDRKGGVEFVQPIRGERE